MPGLVGGGQPGDAPFLRIEAVDVGDAQAIPRKDEHEVLFRQSIEAERQEHGLVFEAAQEQGPGRRRTSPCRPGSMFSMHCTELP